MKRHLLTISILSLIFIHSGLVYSATFGSCQQPELESNYEKEISDANDLRINTGIGKDITFTPNDISISYNPTDTSCQTPIRYEASNDDYKINYSKASLSRYRKITTEGLTNGVWSSTSSMVLFKFKSDHNITIDDTLTVGSDPFNGQTNNREDLVHSSLSFGTDTEPCYQKSIIEEISNEMYQQTYTFRGNVEGEACPLVVKTPVNTYYGELNFKDLIIHLEDDSSTWITVPETGNSYYQVPLYRSITDIGDPLRVALVLRLSDNRFFFYTRAGELIE